MVAFEFAKLAAVMKAANGVQNVKVPEFADFMPPRWSKPPVRKKRMTGQQVGKTLMGAFGLG